MSSTESLHYEMSQEFIQDHPIAVTYLPVAAESFKLKSVSVIQMDDRKAKLRQFIFLELFFNNVVNLDSSPSFRMLLVPRISCRHFSHSFLLRHSRQTK